MTVFVSRADWGNTYARGGYPIDGDDVDKLVCHHTPGQDPTSYDDALRHMRLILAGHRANGWGDIGYTFVVWDKYAFEGRGYFRSGAHAPGANSSSIGVAFLMDGRYRTPTPTEWQTARDIMARAVELGACRAGFGEYGHRDFVSTECPGQLTYDHLDDFYDLAPSPEPVPSIEGHEPLRPFLRPAQFTDTVKLPGGGTGGLGVCDVYDFPVVPAGWTVVVQAADPNRPGEWNVVPYEGARKTDDVGLVAWGRTFKYEADGGAVAICVPQGLNVNIEAVPVAA